MSVELHGRSHPAPKLYEGDLLSGSWTLWVSRDENLQGPSRGHGLKRLGVKGCFNSPSPGASGLAGSRVNDEVSRF